MSTTQVIDLRCMPCCTGGCTDTDCGDCREYDGDGNPLPCRILPVVVTATVTGWNACTGTDLGCELDHDQCDPLIGANCTASMGVDPLTCIVSDSCGVQVFVGPYPFGGAVWTFTLAVQCFAGDVQVTVALNLNAGGSVLCDSSDFVVFPAGTPIPSTYTFHLNGCPCQFTIDLDLSGGGY